MRAKRPQRKTQGARRTSSVIWIGGRYPLPDIAGASAELVLWLELPSELVVYGSAVEAQSKDALGDALLLAITSPLAGRPRMPHKVIVANLQSAEEIQRAVPQIEVEIAPTPQIAELARGFLEATRSIFGGEEPNYRYLSDPKVKPEAVQALFEAAQHLWHLAPWNRLLDDHVLRLDIPSLNVNGAAVSIIGALGESLGFILFPSFAGYSVFAALAEDFDGTPPADLGSETIALNFTPAPELLTSMRKEIAKYGWPVASAKAYPDAVHRDESGDLLPLTPHTIAYLTAATRVIVAFFERHPDIDVYDSLDPLEATVDLGNGELARLSVSWEHFA